MSIVYPGIKAREINLGNSYILKGYRDSQGQQAFAECVICQVVSMSDTLSGVIEEHFLHYSRKHGAILPQSLFTFKFKTADPHLQALIQDAQEFGLPMPGYENHKGCAKFYKTGIDGQQFAACAIHVGNELPKRHWLGYL
jgi:hypothetical protein